MAHPQMFVHLEPPVRWRHPECGAVGRPTRTVGEHLAGGCADRVHPAHQLVVAEHRRHGIPRVPATRAIAEPDPTALLARSYPYATMDRVGHGVIRAPHRDNGATAV